MSELLQMDPLPVVTLCELIGFAGHWLAAERE